MAVEKEEIAALLNEKFSEVTRRFDGLESRFDGLESRFDGLEARFDGLEPRFDGLEARFDGLEPRFDGLESRFDGLEPRFDGLESRFNYVDSEVGKLRVDSHEMKNMLQRNNELIHAVDEKLERFRDETIENLDDIRSDIRISFSMLGRRVNRPPELPS